MEENKEVVNSKTDKVFPNNLRTRDGVVVPQIAAVILLDVYIHGKVVIDGRNNGTHKLQKDEKVHFDRGFFCLFSILRLRSGNEIANNCLHDFSVLTRMN